MIVALCTPCRSGSVRYEHMHSCLDTFQAANKRGITLVHLVAAGCSILPRTRNQLVAVALEKGAEWVVFVDDDIAFDAADFFKLIDHDVDVIGAAPARRHKRWDEKPMSVVKPKGGGKIKQYETAVGRLWEVERLATAFIAIRATVFKDIEQLTEPYRSDGRRYATRTWFWFDLHEVDGEVWDEGEDYNFCRKWVAAGGTCFLDPDIRLRHYDGGVCHDYCPADMETAALAAE